MENKSFRFFLVSVLMVFCSCVLGQNIKGHYVSRSMAGSTLYHTMPMTLFENNEYGDLTFDLTYKQNSKNVTMNFTYRTKQATPADSVQFINGTTVISDRMEMIYIEPDKKLWKHRYTLSDKMEKFISFFHNKANIEAVIYAKGTAYRYKIKKAAWSDYAPIGFKIFEMIQLNEDSKKSER